ncbi:MarR family winged helix-turn-helix transcriptional regulator [Marinobacterium lutimaris]|uniref:MarR family winged helix-turn-helix transcriptional regulator n=1 Tax=Marinobacterium lutimaris TaxID=568106 RepID=UPI001F42EABD|nr:MarR family transcriptional regulator [Marinobacterium lutimaris]
MTEQIGHLIRKAHQRHTAIFQQLSCDKQLTPMQFAILCTVVDNGPSSQTELVRLTAIDQATIRGVISRLNKRGLIEFKSDPRDQRKVIVHITDEGKALVNNMIPRAFEITEKTLENLTGTERVALALLLNKMNS